MRRFSLLFIFLFAVAAAHASLVGLPVVAPGSTVSNTDDVLGVDHNGINPVGSLFLDTGVQNFNFTGSGITTAGTVREVVYKEGGGTLDFLMEVNVSSGSLSEVSQVNTGNFMQFTTEIGTISPVALLGLGTGTFFPTSVSRTGGGDTIIFNFNNPITKGESATMVISTNATNAIGSNIGLIGAGGGTQTVDGFQPTNVPEPATLSILGVGLIAMSFIRRRRAEK
jgi:hypothetical protein